MSVRAVNGYGPRCGCGGKSVLHVGEWFLCAGCVDEAVYLLRRAYPDQPPHWPGDAGRDEPYVFPGERAA